MNKQIHLIARWISILAHPLVMVALLASMAGWRSSSRTTVIQVLLPVGAAIIIPLSILMFRQVRSGRWSNVDASNPSERPVLFIMALAGSAALLVWFLLNDSPMYLIRGLLVISAFLIVTAVLIRWVKISLHMAFASLAATSLSLLGSPIGYALIGVIPLLAWSRLALSRHRPHEIVLGLMLGILTGAALVRV